MLDITKCFSILIASENGSRCNDLKKILKSELNYLDETTGKYNVVIMKYGKLSMSNDYKRISKRIAAVVTPLFNDVDDYFFSIDLQKERFV